MLPEITCCLPSCFRKEHHPLAHSPNGSSFFKNIIYPEGFPGQTESLHFIASTADTPYILLCTRGHIVFPDPYALERMRQIAAMTNAPMVYSDYRTSRMGSIIPHPTLPYQEGSLRDDFDFGALWLLNTSVFRKVVAQMKEKRRYSALYELRLGLSREGPLIRIPEQLYTEDETDFRVSGEKQFDYVNPKQREVQLEMEAVCSNHLDAVGALLHPPFESVNPDHMAQTEVSVIIPVRNRERTISDAIRSALEQETDFPFNILVVDNHSTDRTPDIIREWTERDDRVIRLVPESPHLGIGGCWSLAIMHPACGKFSVQLDSDDLYIHSGALRQIRETFYREQCVMVIGSYSMVNFQLEAIPPGLIDHREWSPENGPNNALRINGLGAPRAFYTPVLKEIRFPNVSYGEDYAVALAISRKYRIGRIYDSLYLCRRWEGNSDADLPIEKTNAHNYYKDSIRSMELNARKIINAAKEK